MTSHSSASMAFVREASVVASSVLTRTWNSSLCVYFPDDGGAKEVTLESVFCCQFPVIPSRSDNWIVAAMDFPNKDTFEDDCFDHCCLQ